MSITGKVARYESSDRVAFFLNDLFEHIDLCRCSILFVIDESSTISPSISFVMKL